MEILFQLRKLRWILLSFWLLLTAGGLVVELAKNASPERRKSEWTYFLGLSYEQNLPTWYSSSMLLLCAVMLLLISCSAKTGGLPFRWHWRLLAFIFFYISLDEAVTLHEALSHFFDYDGVLYYGWVIPASIVVVVLGCFYLPFVLKLPPRTKWQVIVAGSAYVGGALGVEFLLGYWADLAGDKNLVYGLIDLVEESLEILGMTLFLLALVEFAGGDREQGKIRFGELRVES